MQPARDPLDGTVLLLVDATNVLYAIGRRLGGGRGAAPRPGAFTGPGTGGGTVHREGPDGTPFGDAERPAPVERPAPMAALVGRMRAAIPANIRIELVFDGVPERQMRGTRIASGTTVRFAGRMSADFAILERLGAGSGPAMPGALESEGILVITDDRALGVAIRTRGGRTVGSAWLLARLDRPSLSAPSVGNRRQPATSASAAARLAEQADGDERPGWKPGRGATTKHGNAKRAPRRR